MSRATASRFAALLLLMAAAPAANAVPLNLLTPTPDTLSALIGVTYTAGSPGSLTANGTALTFDDGLGGGPIPISDGVFALAASIDMDGVASGGSLMISGTLDGGSPSGTLLTGSLAEFGFGGAGSALEFVFDVTGGALQPQYGPTANVVLAEADFPGSFANDFTNIPSAGLSLGLADTAVPEPSTLALVLLGSIGLAVQGRRPSR